jgi:hypothetical protein
MPKKQTEKKKPSALGSLDHFLLLPSEGPGRDDMMQLYAWVLEDAIKAQDEWSALYGPNVQGRGPLFRWMGAQELKDLHELYRAKKNVALIIEALYVCSLNSLPIPRWCEMAFLAAYRKVRQYKAKSWDEVFGRPHPKGIHLDRKEMEREKSLRVYRRIREVSKGNLFGKREKELEEGMQVRDRNGRIKWYNPSAIGETLFERIGKEFNVGKTLTEEYYYTWKRRLENRKLK